MSQTGCLQGTYIRKNKMMKQEKWCHEFQKQCLSWVTILPSFTSPSPSPRITSPKKELPQAEFADSQGERECQEADPCPCGQNNSGTA